MQPQDKKPTRRVTRMALLTAIALTIFMAEAQIPNPIPIPGIKLGLANIVTVYSMFLLGPADTLMILVSRVFLGSVFSGQMMTFLYSLSGGLLCYVAMLFLRLVLTKDQIWVCSCIGGACHNLGQLAATMLVLRTTVVVFYLPHLLLAGLCAGLFTGLCAQFLIRHLDQSGG